MRSGTNFIFHLTHAPLHQRAILVPSYPTFGRTRPTSDVLVHALAPKDRVAALEFEARRWKHEIFSVMLERRLEPDGLVGIFEKPVAVF